ncbi:unnamed protein product [Cuscuta epithymum]|uniref:Uncharacterized protein n=1 Tax=Cuscuta epithymum TaxID=186058 RepID=A0AAV0E481_9ASTE|nr:unnamed protein product [Cuscuta epithymum]
MVSPQPIRFVLSSNRSKITLGTIGEHHKWKEGAKIPKQNEDLEFWCYTRSSMLHTRSGKLLKSQIKSTREQGNMQEDFLTRSRIHTRSGGRHTRSGMTPDFQFRGNNPYPIG